jgi:hypothetical protein
MGLDTYASRSPDDIELTEEDIQAFQEADITLCGGLFSGNDGSFRGKVYGAGWVWWGGIEGFRTSRRHNEATCQPQANVTTISGNTHLKYFKVILLIKSFIMDLESIISANIKAA